MNLEEPDIRISPITGRPAYWSRYSDYNSKLDYYIRDFLTDEEETQPVAYMDWWASKQLTEMEILALVAQ